MADEHGGPATRSYDALVGGLHATPAHVVHPGRQSGVQLTVTPLGARALLGLPAAALAGLDAAAGDALGPGVERVREQLLDAATWPQRFAVLDTWLASRADQQARLPAEVAQAWRLLTAPGNQVRVAEVADEVGWSGRHLRSRLAAEVGVTPKLAARLGRFDRTRRLLQRQVRAGRPAALADLAAACGYADQAHLSREFRELAGCPPSGWLREEFPNVQANGPGSAGGWGHERTHPPTPGLAHPARP